MNKKVKSVIAGLCLSTFLIAVPAQACTLFAASGDNVIDGGSIIGKTRDEKPGLQYLKLVEPKNGYRYYGLTIDSDNGELRGGINEKGLVVFCSSASTVPAAERKAVKRFRSEYGVTDEHIISKFSTVDEALKADKSIWAGPQNIMLADKNKIAIVEIAPDGSISVTEKKNGTLAHTNHYVDESMLWANKTKPREDSVIRYNRAKELLNSKQKLDMIDFIAFTEDRNAGAKDSIWRHLDGNVSQTLGALVIHLPKKGEPSIYVKVREKPEDKGQETVIHLTADQLFKK